MNLKSVFLLSLFSAMLFLSGCAVDRQEVKTANDIAAESEVLGNALLNSIRKEDFKAFHACTPGSALETMTEKEFLDTCRNQQRQFGKILSSRYLCSLETPLVQNSVWIVTFERKSEANPQKTIRQELLFRVLTSKEDGKLRIMALGFL